MGKLIDAPEALRIGLITMFPMPATQPAAGTFPHSEYIL